MRCRGRTDIASAVPTDALVMQRHDMPIEGPSPRPMPLRSARVLGVPIHAVDWPSALETISQWASRRESRCVCICNVHSVVTASQQAEFRAAIEQADLATPDGAPVAWMLRRLGIARQERISGPDLMRRYCALAASRNESSFLLGGTDSVLQRLQDTLHNDFPGLRIAGTCSPPFRPLTSEEDDAIVAQINASGAGVVWVGLGCPKQELWMHAHRGRVQAVMVGVGAAFPYLSGMARRAPKWMQRSGLEWLHRLASEPRRLWRRYLFTNSYFIVGALGQLCRRLLAR
jgi:N-acetylglucosaminyldiphosphoundecaprenol N-acetyl-beta-D-mannosaminyltransferase